MALRFQQKLIIPSASRPLAARVQLLAQLEQAITSKRVIVLAAPAGWGKTTALTQWAASSPIPVAWYALDTADRDPKLFLDYLLHAVAPAVPDTATIINQLATTTPQHLSELIRTTALTIAAAPTKFTLVFDDFHTIEDEPLPSSSGTALIFDLLASIVEYASNCHLVFASRTLPAIRGLVRLVAQQRAAIFDYTALQFSAADIQELADMGYSLTLSDDSADHLMTKLSGWVTGIVLSLDQAALVPQRTRERQTPAQAQQWSDALLDAQPPMPVQADMTQVYAFFAEQIIAPLAPEFQRFLEETSVLEDLSPQRCDTLRERNDSATFLEHIQRHGLFVSSRAGWLSYHSMFRDFLQSRLARDSLRHQHLLYRAGDIYRDEDDIERALNCYLAAKAQAQAIQLIRAALPRLREYSRQATLLACFDRLDQEHIRSTDLLLAQARICGDMALWERAYLAIQLVEAIGSPEERWEAQITWAGLHCLQGNHAQAHAILDDVPVASLSGRLRFLYYCATGRIHILAGAISDAIAALEQAHALTPSDAKLVDDPVETARVYDLLGWAYARQGDLQAAQRHLRRADAWWQASGNNGRRAMTLNNLGMVALDEGRYREARDIFTSGLKVAAQMAFRREETVLNCSLAELDILEGELEQANARFNQAYTLAVYIDIDSSIKAAAVGIFWVAILQGNHEVAQRWLTIASTISNAGQLEVRGRLALGHSALLFLESSPDHNRIDELLAESGAAEGSLSKTDQAYAALLRASINLDRYGWEQAVAEWETFTRRAMNLPEALLVQFVPSHQHLFMIARQSSALARRLSQSLIVPKHPVLPQAPNAPFNPPEPHRWQVTTLGVFTCTANGVPCELSPLHRALLVRLLDAGPQGLTVERLWESIWGNSLLSMPALHQALRRLRLQSGLAVAARDGSCVIRSSWKAIEYDVHLLEEALRTPTNYESIQRATKLYRGDFLPGTPLSASLWVEARRAHLQQRYLDALERFAHSSENDMPHLAIQYYQQVLQIDGCREQTAAQLMCLAARFGNRSLVSTTFEHLKGSLNSLGTTPEPTTTALYRKLQ